MFTYLYYFYYLKMFRKYSDNLVLEYREFTKIGKYAYQLTVEVNKIIGLASFHKKVDLIRLHRELNISGKQFIHKYSSKFKTR